MSWSNSWVECWRASIMRRIIDRMGVDVGDEVGASDGASRPHSRSPFARSAPGVPWPDPAARGHSRPPIRPGPPAWPAPPLRAAAPVGGYGVAANWLLNWVSSDATFSLSGGVDPTVGVGLNQIGQRGHRGRQPAPQVVVPWCGPDEHAGGQAQRTGQRPSQQSRTDSRGRLGHRHRKHEQQRGRRRCRGGLGRDDAGEEHHESHHRHGHHRQRPCWSTPPCPGR